MKQLDNHNSQLIFFIPQIFFFTLVPKTESALCTKRIFPKPPPIKYTLQKLKTQQNQDTHRQPNRTIINNIHNFYDLQRKGKQKKRQNKNSTRRGQRGVSTTAPPHRAGPEITFSEPTQAKSQKPKSHFKLSSLRYLLAIYIKASPMRFHCILASLMQSRLPIFSTSNVSTKVSKQDVAKKCLC